MLGDEFAVSLVAFTGRFTSEGGVSALDSEPLSFASARRQNQPRGGGRRLLISAPRAAGCASHLTEAPFEFFNWKLQFQRCGFIKASLIKRSTPHFVCRGCNLKYLAEQNSFSGVRSYVSASDFTQISIPCSHYSDPAYRITFALRIVNEARQGLRCDRLDSLRRLANGNRSSLPRQIHDFVVRLRGCGHRRI